MFRFLLAWALIATIYVHSPQRPGGVHAVDVSTLAGAASAAAGAVPLPAGVPAGLAEAALRKTLSGAAPPGPLPGSPDPSARP